MRTAEICDMLPFLLHNDIIKVAKVANDVIHGDVDRVEKKKAAGEYDEQKSSASTA